MKVLLVIFVLATILVLSHEQTIQQTLKEWRKLVAPHFSRCMCQSNTDSELIEGFFQLGEIPNNPCFKCNVRCWGQGIGVISTSGNLNNTIYKSIFGITDDIVAKCGPNKHVDICQKAFEIMQCTYNMIAARAARKIVPITTVPVVPQINVWNTVHPSVILSETVI